MKNAMFVRRTFLTTPRKTIDHQVGQTTCPKDQNGGPRCSVYQDDISDLLSWFLRPDQKRFPTVSDDAVDRAGSVTRRTLRTTRVSQHIIKRSQSLTSRPHTADTPASVAAEPRLRDADKTARAAGRVA